MKKAIFMLKGGLGNQLFQLSFMLDARGKYGLDIEFSELHLVHDNLRKLEIRTILKAAAFEEKRFNYLVEKIRFLYRLYKIVVEKLCVSYLHEPTLNEIDIISKTENKKGNTFYVDGYFQSKEHGRRNISEIRTLLFENTPLNAESNAYLSVINSSCISISLHVRRGDYVNQKTTNEFHGVCGSDYYHKAVERAKAFSAHCDVSFFIFSDDIKWCKNNLLYLGLNIYDKIIFVERDKYAGPFQDMLLMSLCNINVIANSTYSWWAAMLGEIHDDHRVIAPKDWFQDSDIPFNLVNEGWTVI